MSRKPLASRRHFLKTAAAGAGGLLILPSARTALAYRANERLRLAVVGMAGFGAYHGFADLIHTYDNVGFAVSCDVDQRKVQKVYDFWSERAKEWSASDDPVKRKAAAEHYGPLAAKRLPLFADYRKMFDEAADQFDAVVVATPDHTHAIISAAALRAGKPAFSEKPLTISAHDARALCAVTKQTKLPTQMNNHGASSAGFRRGLEIVREGLLGEVREVHVFFSRGGQNFTVPPSGSFPVPPELNWDCWLAQVKWREYHPGWINRIAWRETSIGELGNFGPHSANLAFMSLNVKDLWQGGGRIKIVAECSEANQLSYPRWEQIRWEVPARGSLSPVAFTWHHGQKPDYAEGSRAKLEAILRDRGATDKELPKLLPMAGCLMLGSKGLLATTSHNTEIVLLPKAKFENVEQKKPLGLKAWDGHYKAWLEACRGGPTPISNFEYAAPFGEFLNLGSIATRLPGEEIEYDPATGQITNHPRAAAFLGYEFRKGYTI